MHTVQLRNLSDKTYKALKDLARKSKRSVSQQAVHLIEASLGQDVDKKHHTQRKYEAFDNLEKLNNNSIYDRDKTIHWIRKERDL